MPDAKFAYLVRGAELAIRNVWEAEWRRADYFHALLEAYGEDVTRAVMAEVGRSHQDAFRWANLAAEWPPDDRLWIYSPREHTRMKRAEDGSAKPTASKNKNAVRGARRRVARGVARLEGEADRAGSMGRGRLEVEGDPPGGALEEVSLLST